MVAHVWATVIILFDCVRGTCTCPICIVHVGCISHDLDISFGFCYVVNERGVRDIQLICACGYSYEHVKIGISCIRREL